MVHASPLCQGGEGSDGGDRTGPRLLCVRQPRCEGRADLHESRQRPAASLERAQRFSQSAVRTDLGGTRQQPGAFYSIRPGAVPVRQYHASDSADPGQHRDPLVRAPVGPSDLFPYVPDSLLYRTRPQRWEFLRYMFHLSGAARGAVHRRLSRLWADRASGRASAGAAPGARTLDGGAHMNSLHQPEAIRQRDNNLGVPTDALADHVKEEVANSFMVETCTKILD